MLTPSLRYLCLLVALSQQIPCAISADDPGRSVVLRLQQRFDDIRPECANRSPAINCNGVIIRAIRDASNPAFWNPSPENVERKGVSFSYIRKDVGNERLAGDAGLIMAPLGEPSEQPLRVRCVFPLNAGTDSRIESCGTEAFPLPCHLSGVVDIPSWQAHFAEYPGTTSCYFEPTARWFQFSIEVRQHFPIPDHRRFWNEIVIEPWPQDIPEKLPLEALYYSGEDGGLEKARQMQENYIRATGKFIPVVRIELTRTPVFYYAPKDQVTISN